MIINGFQVQYHSRTLVVKCIDVILPVITITIITPLLESGYFP